MEFFHECMQEIVSDLLQAFTALLEEGETSAYINKGIITLIPKSSNHARLNNWWSITLLGSIYKILSKVLAGRLQTVLPNIIRPN
jgi:mannosylglycoprotein endo-beta-mannosidase